MKPTRVIAIIPVVCACVAASSLNAATLPAGTTITVSTVSAFSSKTVAGRSFEGKLAQDVSVKGHVLMKAGSKVFGKIASSRSNPRKNDPLTVELTSVSVKGNVVLKAGTKVFGKVTSSRANSRKSGPLAVELASIDLKFCCVLGLTRRANR